MTFTFNPLYGEFDISKGSGSGPTPTPTGTGIGFAYLVLTQEVQLSDPTGSGTFTPFPSKENWKLIDPHNLNCFSFSEEYAPAIVCTLPEFLVCGISGLSFTASNPNTPAPTYQGTPPGDYSLPSWSTTLMVSGLWAPTSLISNGWMIYNTTTTIAANEMALIAWKSI